MTNNPNRIEFQQVRNFGEVLTVTFDFVRENFKPLMKGWLYIVGPLALTNAFISIYSIDMSSSFSQFFSLLSLINLILGVLTYFLTYLVTLGYLHLYLHKKLPVEFNDLRQFTKQNFWFFTGQYIVLIIITITGFVLLIIPGLYLIIVLSIAPIIRIMERRSIFASISRARQLMSGFWWQTFGLTVVLFIILLVFGGLLQAPSIVLTFLWTFNNIEAGSFSGSPADNYPLLAVVAAIGQALAVCVNIIPMVAYSLQYFNLRERKEAVSLMDKVESLGTNKE
ncbi:MAG: hypothetical protein VX603_03740 [Gemmatimonadota bacterium]|jgi:hypothetical protein|nr:hypothetical protein [Gemmatimonadota bacterium]